VSTAEFERAVNDVAVELTGWPSSFSDAHIHFDDQRFGGLVPEFSSAEWLRLAPVAALATADVRGSFLIVVPIDESESPPEPFNLASVELLRPWETPSIHILRQGSAFEIRGMHSPHAWYADAAPADGTVGWVSGYRVEDEDVWRLSLMYETVAS
jgi:hypothetical protein